MSESNELEMSSVEAQLCVLYDEKQRLEEELGSSRTDDILTMIDELNARIADLESASERTPELDELDALRVQVAELVAERESFLLSVDADSLTQVRESLEDLRTRPTLPNQPFDPMSQNDDTDYDTETFEGAIDDAIGMADEVNTSFETNSVQDAATIANDLRTLAEQLNGVFEKSHLVFTGRLHGGQWKFECHNG